VLRTLLVLAILIPGICAAVFDRFSALMLYVWFALFRPQEWLWWDISSLRLSLVLGVLLLGPSLMTGVLPYVAHPISLGGIVFLCSALLGQLGAFSPETGWYWLDFFFRLLLVCLFAITIVSDSRRFRLALAIIAGSLGFHSAKAGLVCLLGGGVRFFDGLAGAFVDNNGYAVGMAMIAPLLFASSQNMEKRWLRLAFLAAAPLSAFAVIGTFSRGGFLAITSAGLTLMMLDQRKGRALMLAVAVAVPVAAFMASQEGYVDRLQTIRTYEDTNEESALSRLHFWRVAVTMALDQPTGVGLFNYESAYDRYDSSNGRFGSHRSVHSSHFQVLAETGFLGLAAFEGVLLYSIVCAMRIRRRSRTPNLDPADARLFLTAANGLIASTIAFLIGGAFVAMALNDLTWMLLSMVASLDLISARACEQAESTAPQPVVHAGALAIGWQPRRQGAIV
jgi:putative inorganic carbon (hco3(-)) transporter